MPWVLVGFSVLLGGSTTVDLMGSSRRRVQLFFSPRVAIIFVQFVTGIVVGHTYYYLEDVFPKQPGGFRLLKTPRFMYAFLN